MTDVQTAILIVGLIVACGGIVAVVDYRDPNVLPDSPERRQMAIKRDTTGRVA